MATTYLFFVLLPKSVDGSKEVKILVSAGVLFAPLI